MLDKTYKYCEELVNKQCKYAKEYITDGKPAAHDQSVYAQGMIDLWNAIISEAYTNTSTKLL